MGRRMADIFGRVCYQLKLFPALEPLTSPVREDGYRTVAAMTFHIRFSLPRLEKERGLIPIVLISTYWILRSKVRSMLLKRTEKKI